MNGSTILANFARDKHANLVRHTCLRPPHSTSGLRKDAYDLIYCIALASNGVDAVPQAFRKEIGGKMAL